VTFTRLKAIFLVYIYSFLMTRQTSSLDTKHTIMTKTNQFMIAVKSMNKDISKVDVFVFYIYRH